MTHYRLLYPKKYLAAHDLLEKDVTLTIRAVVREELRSKEGTEIRPVIYFEETKAKAEREKTEEKRFVCNITNADTIALALNEVHHEKWIGRRVTLFPTTASVGGAVKPCIRIRPHAPQPKPATTVPETTTTTTQEDAPNGSH